MLIIAWLGSARLATSCTTEPVRARVYCPPNAQFLSQHVTFKSASHTRELHKRASSSVSTQPKSTHPPFTITTAAAASQPSAAFGCLRLRVVREPMRQRQRCQTAPPASRGCQPTWHTVDRCLSVQPTVVQRAVTRSLREPRQKTREKNSAAPSVVSFRHFRLFCCVVSSSGLGHTAVRRNVATESVVRVVSVFFGRAAAASCRSAVRPSGLTGHTAIGQPGK